MACIPAMLTWGPSAEASTWCNRGLESKMLGHDSGLKLKTNLFRMKEHFTGSEGCCVKGPEM